MARLGRLGRFRTFAIPHMCENSSFHIMYMYARAHTRIEDRQNVLNVLTGHKSQVIDRS